MVSCVGDLQVDDAEPEMGENDGQATNVAYDEDGYEPGILDEIDFEPIEGDSSNGGGGSMSFSDEQPEKLRDGSSADGGSVRAGSIRSSRMSRDSLDIPDAFAFDEESVGRSTSQASSRRSKLSILGHDPLGMDEESHTIFGESSLSLHEEYESHPSLLDRHSQMPLSQRIPPHAMAIAQKMAQAMPDKDSTLSFLSIVNPNSKSKKTASKVFYHCLQLHAEGIIHLTQHKPYEDITICPTGLTTNYVSQSK